MRTIITILVLLLATACSSDTATATTQAEGRDVARDLVPDLASWSDGEIDELATLICDSKANGFSEDEIIAHVVTTSDEAQIVGALMGYADTFVC